jgi:glycosyltransferase involved in cell wall biosynthesis
MEFEVLMSVYQGESADSLNESLSSLVRQTLAPQTVVLVEDGPLSQSLTDIIEAYRNRLNILSIPLPTNQGLPVALNAGLSKCTCEWIARFDSDDICLPERFEKQMQFVTLNPQIDVLGAQIEEFEMLGHKHRVRQVPTNHDEIAHFAQKRNPMNHMTVLYRRKKVLEVGGYPSLTGFEDYGLWIKLIQAKAKFHNLAEVLVYARVNGAFISRRGGYKYFYHELKALSFFHSSGFLSRSRFITNLLLRSLVRIAPESLRSILYRQLRKTSA